jgi:hypothetical protein
MAKAVALRERDHQEEADKLLTEGLRIADEQDDPRDRGLDPRTRVLNMADRGESEAAVAMARHNCELTEQLGDVFLTQPSRSTPSLTCILRPANSRGA